MDWRVKWLGLLVPVMAVVLYALYAPLLMQTRPAPMEAPLLAAEPLSPVHAFCQSVKQSKAFCWRTHIDCRQWQPKPADFLNAARACFKNPNPLKANDAERFLKVFDDYRSALCCA